MKTYWLRHREARPPFKRTFEAVCTDAESDLLEERHNTSTTTINEDRRGMYSPITFQDIARRSAASSPSKDLFSPRDCRSNSTGTINNSSKKNILTKSPSCVFGSLVSNSGIGLSAINSAKPNSTCYTSQALTNQANILNRDIISANILVQRNSKNSKLRNSNIYLKYDKCNCNKSMNIVNYKQDTTSFLNVAQKEEKPTETNNISVSLCSNKNSWKLQEQCCSAFQTKRNRQYTNACTIC